MLVFLVLVLRDLVSPTPDGVFTSGHGGYSCYRIPAIVSPSPGQLLLAVEARRHDCEVPRGL